MKRLFAIFALFVLTSSFIGCSRPEPDYSIVHYGCEVPYLDAMVHASKIKDGIAYRTIGTSMEPMIFEGDFIVVDPHFPYENIQPRMIINYQAVWTPKNSLTTSHMAAKRYPDGSWIMDGINNVEYENGSKAMTKDHYRGRVVGIYTSRKK